VDCEWDPAKARTNFAKHGIYFADAVSALEDEGALTIRDSRSDDEERWITLGMDALAGFWWSSIRGAARACGSSPPGQQPRTSGSNMK
jgi:uncharacterized DUF497 family protein